MDGLIALAYAKKLYDLAEGPQGPPGEVSEAELTAALATKANTDGYYENLGSGTADNLVTDVKANDQSPYLFRTSGGSVDIGDREYVNGIVGGTVAFNQLVATLRNSGTLNGLTITADSTNMTVRLAGTSTKRETYTLGSVSSGVIPANHVAVGFAGVNRTADYSPNFQGITPPLGTDGVVVKRVNSGGVAVNLSVENGVTIDVTTRPFIIDLTQLFGSTIADYIYSLEQATAGAGVVWFKKLFPKPYYAYNAGELLSVSGLQSHDMVGFNAWDEEWELGYYNVTTGEPATSSSNLRGKNFVPVVPNTSYYAKIPTGYIAICEYDADKNFIKCTQGVANSGITTTADTHFIKFHCTSAYGTTYNHDICINLSWDGSRDGEYEPYVKHSYPLDSDLTLRGIPKLDASNNLYYDGDVYEADGTVTRKYGVVDLGTLSWVRNDQNQDFYSSGINNKVKPSTMSAVCPKYETVDQHSSADKSIRVSGSQLVRIRDTAYTDASALKASLSGVYLVYELATPTTESADPYQATQLVDDFGTEEFVLSSGAFPMPVGHNTDYPVNLKAKLEMAPNSPDGDGDYIVRQTDGENSYVKLVIEDALPTMPTTAGNYVLTVTIAEGQDPVLDWVAQA